MPGRGGYLLMTLRDYKMDDASLQPDGQGWLSDPIEEIHKRFIATRPAGSVLVAYCRYPGPLGGMHTSDWLWLGPDGGSVTSQRMCDEDAASATVLAVAPDIANHLRERLDDLHLWSLLEADM